MSGAFPHLPRCAAPHTGTTRVPTPHVVGPCGREAGHGGPHHFPILPPLTVWCGDHSGCSPAG